MECTIWNVLMYNLHAELWTTIAAVSNQQLEVTPSLHQRCRSSHHEQYDSCTYQQIIEIEHVTRHIQDEGEGQDEDAHCCHDQSHDKPSLGFHELVESLVSARLKQLHGYVGLSDSLERLLSRGCLCYNILGDLWFGVPANSTGW